MIPPLSDGIVSAEKGRENDIPQNWRESFYELIGLRFEGVVLFYELAEKEGESSSLYTVPRLTRIQLISSLFNVQLERLMHACACANN